MSQSTLPANGMMDLNQNIFADQLAPHTSAYTYQPATKKRKIKVESQKPMAPSVPRHANGMDYYLPGSLQVNGVVRAQGYLQHSDIRLKKDIEDIVDAIDIVTKLQGKTYRWKENTDFERHTGGRKVIGLIAQEVRRVLPDVVTEDEETGFLSISYIDLVPIILEALKEHIRNSELHKEKIEEELTDLKTAVSDMVLKSDEQDEQLKTELEGLQGRLTVLSLKEEDESPRTEEPVYYHVADDRVFFPGVHEISPTFALDELKTVCILGCNGWAPDLSFARHSHTVRSSADMESLQAAKRLCNLTRDAIKEYLPGAMITSYPLANSGSTTMRLKALKKQIISEQKLRQCIIQSNIVIVTTHSQGAPIATILIADLIKRGIIRPDKQRVGIVSLAGIHGPVTSRVGPFDPANDMDVLHIHDEGYQRYTEAVSSILANGVKIAAVASYGDSIADLFSATLDFVDHPNMSRGVYVHPKHIDKFEKSSTWKNPRNFIEEAILFSVRMKNEGHNVDLLRFLAADDSYSNMWVHKDIWEVVAQDKLVQLLFDTHKLVDVLSFPAFLLSLGIKGQVLKDSPWGLNLKSLYKWYKNFRQGVPCHLDIAHSKKAYSFGVEWILSDVHNQKPTPPTLRDDLDRDIQNFNQQIAFFIAQMKCLAEQEWQAEAGPMKAAFKYWKPTNEKEEKLHSALSKQAGWEISEKPFGRYLDALGVRSN
mmetsp:Transcript_11458/g.12571  ORF Transcript_11458/g.12571 Transcript_11458/m.12571 type:complete len:709 (-) Transcript_11458:89-2215(-)